MKITQLSQHWLDHFVRQGDILWLQAQPARTLQKPTGRKAGSGPRERRLCHQGQPTRAKWPGLCQPAAELALACAAVSTKLVFLAMRACFNQRSPDPLPVCSRPWSGDPL